MSTILRARRGTCILILIPSTITSSWSPTRSSSSDHFQNVANAYALYLIDTAGQSPFRSCRCQALLLASLAVGPTARTSPLVQSYRDPQYAVERSGSLCSKQCLPGHGGRQARGKVKWLRINEALPRYWSTGRRWGPSLSSSSWKAALWPRVQWGSSARSKRTVPPILWCRPAAASSTRHWTKTTGKSSGSGLT